LLIADDWCGLFSVFLSKNFKFEILVLANKGTGFDHGQHSLLYWEEKGIGNFSKYIIYIISTTVRRGAMMTDQYFKSAESQAAIN
jgi:hypothetical protein